MTPQRSASVASRQGCKIAANPTSPFVHCGEYLQGLFNIHQDVFSLDLEAYPFCPPQLGLSSEGIGSETPLRNADGHPSTIVTYHFQLLYAIIGAVYLSWSAPGSTQVRR
jgi:hypothetical protein